MARTTVQLSFWCGMKVKAHMIWLDDIILFLIDSQFIESVYICTCQLFWKENISPKNKKKTKQTASEKKKLTDWQMIVTDDDTSKDYIKTVFLPSFYVFGSYDTTVFRLIRQSTYLGG